MDNLEYLKKVKEHDDKKKLPLKGSANWILEYRKVKALEIIAEQIINLDCTLACIETIVRQGG